MGENMMENVLMIKFLSFLSAEEKGGKKKNSVSVLHLKKSSSGLRFITRWVGGGRS